MRLPKDIETIIVDFVWSRYMHAIKRRVHSELRQRILERRLRHELSFYFYNFPLYIHSPAPSLAEPETDEELELVPFLPPAAFAFEDI